MNALSLFSPLLLNRCTSPTSIIGEYVGASNESSMGLSSHHEGTTGMNSSSSLALVLRLLARQRQANDLKLQQQEMVQIAINDQLTTSLLNDLLSRGSVTSMPSSTWL